MSAAAAHRAIALVIVALFTSVGACGRSHSGSPRGSDAGSDSNGSNSMQPDAGASPLPRDAGSVVGPDTEPTADAATHGAVTTVHTSVALTDVGAGETLAVSCTATDADGNPVEGVATTLRVTPHDDAHQLDADSFSTTTAGEYSVACVVGSGLADADPVTVRVHAGPAHAWELTLPSGRCLGEGQALPFTHRVVDAYGNVIAPEAYALSVTSTPAGATLSDGVLRIDGEGQYALSVELDPSVARAAGAQLEPQTTQVHVDSTPPRVEITTPARASTLQQPAAESTVAIAGSVSDASGVSSLELDGAAIDVPAEVTSHAFNASQDARWGLNVIAGEATDACGNRHLFSQAYLLSDAYRSVATEQDESAAAPLGLTVRLNQPVIDDDNRSDLDDIASLAEAELMALDFNTLVPAGRIFAQDPVRNDCSFCNFWGDTGYLIRRHASASQRIYWDGPWVLRARAIDDAISVALRLENFDLPLQASGTLRECACGVPATQSTGTFAGWVGADAVAANATIRVAANNGAVTSAVTAMNVNATGLYFDLDCGWADFLCDAASDIVVPFIADLVEGALEDAITHQVRPLIEAFIESLEVDQPLALPAPFDTPVSIVTKVAAIDVDGPAGSGNAEVVLSVQTYPAQRATTTPQDALGAIARSGAAPTFSSNAYALGFALADDVLNQLLWSVWYGGGVELDAQEIEALVGADDTRGLSLQLSAGLPMVVMPGDAQHAVRVGLGDARIDAVVDLETAFGLLGAGSLAFTAQVSVVADCDLDLDPSTNAVTLSALDADPELDAEIVAIDRPEHEALAHAALLRVLRALVPMLADAAVSALPLPTIDPGTAASPPLKLGAGQLARPNTSNVCVAGTEQPAAAHLCLTGTLE